MQYQRKNPRKLLVCGDCFIKRAKIAKLYTIGLLHSVAIFCVPLADLLAQFANKCWVLCCKVGSLVWVGYHIVELHI